MPRTSRIIIANYPHHIIQRGHNRQAVFTSEGDFLYYLATLQEWKDIYECRIYAYCLMANHVHLVIEPGENVHDLSRLMKRLAGRQTRYVNKRHNRSGTLWEGRFKSSAISTDEYLLACCRYVELNPVRAGIVSDPADYRWSSYGAKIGAQENDWLDYDPCYLRLAESDQKRAEKYASWIKETVLSEEWDLIRTSLQRGQLTGGPRFIDEIEKKIEKRVEFRGRGRPRK